MNNKINDKTNQFSTNKVFIASDHAGVQAKLEAINILKDLNIQFEDLGPKTSKPSVDYPKYAKKVVNQIRNTPGTIGILICGSGTGMQIAANKHKGIRAAFCFDKYSAKMARLDNNANILTLRARQFDTRRYKIIIKTFIETQFSNKKDI